MQLPLQLNPLSCRPHYHLVLCECFEQASVQYPEVGAVFEHGLSANSCQLVVPEWVSVVVELACISLLYL